MSFLFGCSPISLDGGKGAAQLNRIERVQDDFRRTSQLIQL
jgi:hypothetical protein